MCEKWTEVRKYRWEIGINLNINGELFYKGRNRD